MPFLALAITFGYTHIVVISVLFLG